MKKLILLITLTIIMSALGYSQDGKLNGVWVPVDLRWQTDIADPHQKWTQTEVLYFASDNRFSLLVCTAGQDRTRLFISKGDAQGIYLGDWHLLGSDIHVHYILSYRTVDVVGDHPPEEYHNETARLLNSNVIVFHGKRFKREPRLAVSVKEDLQGVRVPDNNPANTVPHQSVP
jgi:hypothetical protein